jgi:hypothetical protein
MGPLLGLPEFDLFLEGEECSDSGTALELLYSLATSLDCEVGQWRLATAVVDPVGQASFYRHTFRYFPFLIVDCF